MDRHPHIAVVGSANIDLVTYADDIPRAGETIFGREFSLGFGGKGANQAVAARLCGANDHLLPADVDAAADLPRRADMIVLQLEVPFETVYYTLRFAREHGIRTILNPAPGQPLDLRQAGVADYAIPNETEAEALGGVPVRSLEDARACALRLLEGGLRRVIVTLGANGALCCMPRFPPWPRARRSRS